MTNTVVKMEGPSHHKFTNHLIEFPTLYLESNPQHIQYIQRYIATRAMPHKQIIDLYISLYIYLYIYHPLIVVHILNGSVSVFKNVSGLLLRIGLLIRIRCFITAINGR